MRHPDLLKIEQRMDRAMARGDERIAAQRESGEANADTTADYAYAENAALEIVGYCRRKGVPVLDDDGDETGIIAVPPMPSSLVASWPEGMEWPEGFTMSADLGDANARKVAAKAIAAEVGRLRDLALNEFRCDRAATDMAQSHTSVIQSLMKAETIEHQVGSFHDPMPADADVGRSVPPRRTGPPVADRRRPSPPPMRP